MKFVLPLQKLRGTKNPIFQPPLLFMTTLPPLLNKLEVTAILRMSDRSIERLVKKQNFPPPLRLGKAAFWEEPKVMEWLNDKLETQRAWKPKLRRRIANVAVVPPANHQALAR